MESRLELRALRMLPIEHSHRPGAHLLIWPPPPPLPDYRYRPEAAGLSLSPQGVPVPSAFLLLPSLAASLHCLSVTRG